MRARFTLGVFGFIFDEPKGGLLVTKNEEESFWSLPGRTIEEEVAKRARSEWLIADELSWELLDKTGLDISGRIPSMPPIYPTISAGGEDISAGVYIGTIRAIDMISIKGEYELVSPKELEELTEAKEGNRLIDGFGGRMHRLCLAGLTQSPNEEYREEAQKMLKGINWLLGRS